MWEEYVNRKSCNIPKSLILMVRHGECNWNYKNLFTGWYDASLTYTGNLAGRKTTSMACVDLAENNRCDNEYCSSINEEKKPLCTIVFVRDGTSQWNELNLFQGWYDSGLAEEGVNEALRAGLTIREKGLLFDEAHTSLLTRAQKTLDIILNSIGQIEIPVHKTWRLNERHYGELTGLNKRDTAEKYGEQQVQIWRRSYNIPPPKMYPDHPYYNTIRKDPRYKDGPSRDEFPNAETLEETIARTLPYWESNIVPKLKAGKTILIVAHGNSLRGIVKHLDKLSDNAIMEINIPTGIPFIYTLGDSLQPIVSMQFIDDEQVVKKAIKKVVDQIRIKEK